MEICPGVETRVYTQVGASAPLALRRPSCPVHYGDWHLGPKLRRWDSPRHFRESEMANPASAAFGFLVLFCCWRGRLRGWMRGSSFVAGLLVCLGFGVFLDLCSGLSVCLAKPVSVSLPLPFFSLDFALPLSRNIFLSLSLPPLHPPFPSISPFPRPSLFPLHPPLRSPPTGTKPPRRGSGITREVTMAAKP